MTKAAEIRARLNGGGSDDDDSEAVVPPEYVGEHAEQAEVERDWWDSVKAFAGGATLDSLGAGEFFAAAADDDGLLGDTIGAAVRGVAGTERGETMDLYEQGRDNVRQANPVAHGAGQVTGAIGAGLAANALLPGSGLQGAASIARSGAIGAGMGAAEEAGQSIHEGSVAPAAWGAAKGGAMGAGGDAVVRGAKQGLRLTKALRNHPGVRRFLSYADEADDMATAPTLPPPPQPKPTGPMPAAQADEAVAASRPTRDIPDLVESSEPFVPGRKVDGPSRYDRYRKLRQEAPTRGQLTQARHDAVKARMKDEEFMMGHAARQQPPPAPGQAPAAPANPADTVAPGAAAKRAAARQRRYDRDFAGETQKELLPPPFKPATPPPPLPPPARVQGLGRTPGAPIRRDFATAGTFEPALTKAERARKALGAGAQRAGQAALGGARRAGNAVMHPIDTTKSAAKRAASAIGLDRPMGPTIAGSTAARKGVDSQFREGGFDRHQFSPTAANTLSDEAILGRMRSELSPPSKPQDEEAARPGSRTQAISRALSEALPQIREADPDMADMVVSAIGSGSAASISSVSRQLRAVPGLNWAAMDPMRKDVER